MAWRADWMSAVFWKITAVYGHIDENGASVRKWLDRKMPITDKMVKNGYLSVKIQTFRTRFYGQMLQKAAFVRKSSSKLSKIYGQIAGKCRFVRKIRFAYGQIIKKRHFVRKIEWDLGWISWAALHLKKPDKVVATRPPSFDISFNSSKKRDFCPSLFVGTNQVNDFVKNDTQF